MMKSEVSRKRGFLSKTALLFLTVLLFGAVGMTVFRVHAAAPEKVDPDRTDCSIDFQMEFLNIVKDKDGKILREETIPTDGGTLSLYTVASVKVLNGYRFDTTAGKFRNVSGIEELETMDSKELEAANNEISQRLEKMAGEIEADQTTKIENGAASFQNLRPGLYLVVQTELSEMDTKIIPFLISIPDKNGNYHLKSEPKSGKAEIETQDLPSRDTYVSSEESEPEPSPEPPERLPQTGQLWWPVPVLCASGAVLVLIGIAFLKTGRKKK